MSLQSELEGMDAFIDDMSRWETRFVPYRIIIAVGIAYVHHYTSIEDDGLSSNLGFLSKFIHSLNTPSEKEPDGRSRLTIVLAFDPRFNEKVGKNNETRLELDIQRINKQINKPPYYGRPRNDNYGAFIGSIRKFYPKKDSLVYIIGAFNPMLCINDILRTSYPAESPVNSAEARIGKPLRQIADSCPPLPGTDMQLIKDFVTRHAFKEVGIFNCAYEDYRSAEYSIRKNKYFDDVCELLNIAYTSGAHPFILDVTMGSYSHPNSQMVVNRRNPTKSLFFPRNQYQPLAPFENRTAFLTVYPLNEKTKFKQGYSTGIYEGGKFTRRYQKKNKKTQRKNTSSRWRRAQTY